MDNTSELLFRTTIVENGKAKEIIAKVYDIIDGIPLFYSKETSGYKIITAKNLGNILVVNLDMLEAMDKVSKKLVNTLTWHMIIQISSGMYKKNKKVLNDCLVDEHVAKICGKDEVIKLLQFIKIFYCENEEQVDKINTRIQYVESKVKLFSETQTLISKDDIISKVNFAFI